MNTNKTLTIMARASALVLALSSLSAWAGPGGVDDGLQVWLRAGSGISASDGQPVVTWSDLSGAGNDAQWNAGNAYGELAPTYDASNPGADDKATVRFDGVNALELDLTFLAGSDYTIFVVNARDRFGLANFYIAGDTPVSDSNLVLGYEQPNLLRQAHFNRDLDATVENYIGQPLWALDTFRFSQGLGKDLFQDGSQLAFDFETTPLASNTGSTLGHFRAFGNFYWFTGDIAEVVVYDRALDELERFLVEAELAGRYDRPLDLENYINCVGDWNNHGDYVSTVAHAVEALVAAGVLTIEEGEETVAEAGSSDCGKS